MANGTVLIRWPIGFIAYLCFEHVAPFTLYRRHPRKGLLKDVDLLQGLATVAGSGNGATFSFLSRGVTET